MTFTTIEVDVCGSMLLIYVGKRFRLQHLYVLSEIIIISAFINHQNLMTKHQLMALSHCEWMAYSKSLHSTISEVKLYSTLWATHSLWCRSLKVSLCFCWYLLSFLFFLSCQGYFCRLCAISLHVICIIILKETV